MADEHRVRGLDDHEIVHAAKRDHASVADGDIPIGIGLNYFAAGRVAQCILRQMPG